MLCKILCDKMKMLPDGHPPRIGRNSRAHFVDCTLQVCVVHLKQESMNPFKPLTMKNTMKMFLWHCKLQYFTSSYSLHQLSSVHHVWSNFIH